jgi:hypothetical protein
MGHPDGAHTHGGGGFDPMPIVIIIAALAVASGVATAVAQLVWLLLVALAVVAMAAAAVVVIVVRHRLRHPQPPRGLLVQRSQPPEWQRLPVRPRSERPAIEAPRQVHLPFHGVSAEDVAAIIVRQADGPLNGDLGRP